MHSHVNIAPAGPETAQKHGQDTSRGSPWLRSPGGFSWNLSSLFFFQRFTTVLALEADYRHRVESKEGFSCRARFHGSTNADLASERAPLDSRSGPDFPKEMCSLFNIQQLRYVHLVVHHCMWRSLVCLSKFTNWQQAMSVHNLDSIIFKTQHFIAILLKRIIGACFTLSLSNIYIY